MKNLQHQFPEYSATIETTEHGCYMNFYYNNMLDSIEDITGHPERSVDYLDEWANHEIQPHEAINEVDKFYEQH